MAILGGFIDESPIDSANLMSASGFLLTMAQARKLQAAWEPAFRRYGGFHSAPLNARKGPYEGISDEELERLLNGARYLLVERTEFMVTVNCRVRDVAEVYGITKPTLAKRKAWATCCTEVATMMAGYLTNHKKSSDRVVYTFEQVPKGRGEIDRIFYLVADHEALRRDFAYADHGFKSKQECPLLEPADFIAWEWSRHQVSRLDKGGAYRLHFRRLFEGVKSAGYVYFNRMTATHIKNQRDMLEEIATTYRRRPKR